MENNVYFQNGHLILFLDVAQAWDKTKPHTNTAPNVLQFDVKPQKSKAIKLLYLEYNTCLWWRMEQRLYAGEGDMIYMIYMPSRPTPYPPSLSSLFKCPYSMKPCHSQPPPHPRAPTKHSRTLRTLTHPPTLKNKQPGTHSPPPVFWIWLKPKPL